MQAETSRKSEVWPFIKKEVLTIPNIISMARIVIIPHILELYLGGDYRRAAVWIVISFLSDVADGVIARHFNMISSVGKVLDPIADKLTQGMVFICLISRYRWLGWFTCFFAFKELTVCYLGFMSVMYTRKVDQAHWYGKMCTAVVIASILVLVLFPELSATAMKCIAGLCASVLVFSLFMYARNYQRLINEKITPIPGDHTASMVGIAVAWLVTIAGGAVMIAAGKTLGRPEAAAFISDNMFLLFAAVLLLFLLKAFGLPVYMGLIYMVCGYLFGMPQAVAVCVLGCVTASLIQYWRGRKRYTGHQDELKKRLSCFEAYHRLREKSLLLFVILSRYMSLPSEVVGIYMGASGIKPPQYLLGSVLGRIADMVLFSIMGAHISDVGSIEFILAASVKVLFTCIIVLVLYFNGRRIQARENAEVRA